MDKPFWHKVITCLIALCVLLTLFCGAGYFFAGPVGILYGLGALASAVLFGMLQSVIQFFITPRDQH